MSGIPAGGADFLAAIFPGAPMGPHAGRVSRWPVQLLASFSSGPVPEGSEGFSRMPAAFGRQSADMAGGPAGSGIPAGERASVDRPATNAEVPRQRPTGRPG